MGGGQEKVAIRIKAVLNCGGTLLEAPNKPPVLKPTFHDQHVNRMAAKKE